MTYVKTDQVKQSIDSLEKYRLFTENKLELFFRKEFDQCGSLLRKIILEGENVSFTDTTSIKSRGKKQPRSVFQKLFASVVQSWSGLHRMLTDFWYLLLERIKALRDMYDMLIIF